MRIGLKFSETPVEGSATRFISEEDSDEPPRDVRRDLPKIDQPSRPMGMLNLDAIAKEVVEFLERFHQQIIQREPDGAPPIRIPSEEPAVRLGGLVIHPILVAIDAKNIGMI